MIARTDSPSCNAHLPLIRRLRPQASQIPHNRALVKKGGKKFQISLSILAHFAPTGYYTRSPPLLRGRSFHSTISFCLQCKKRPPKVKFQFQSIKKLSRRENFIRNTGRQRTSNKSHDYFTSEMKSASLVA